MLQSFLQQMYKCLHHNLTLYIRKNTYATLMQIFHAAGSQKEHAMNFLSRCFITFFKRMLDLMICLEAMPIAMG